MNGVYGGFKTKKSLKDAVKDGERPELMQTGMFGPDLKSPQAIVGPDPYSARNWYAQVWLDENNRICKVK